MVKHILIDNLSNILGSKNYTHCNNAQECAFKLFSFKIGLFLLKYRAITVPPLTVLHLNSSYSNCPCFLNCLASTVHTTNCPISLNFYPLAVPATYFCAPFLTQLLYCPSSLYINPLTVYASLLSLDLDLCPPPPTVPVSYYTDSREREFL